METAKFITASEWRKRGELYTVFNKDLFTIDIGDNDDCMVILHGYLTSSFDYYKVIDQLSKKYRVIVHDLIGFGFSEKVTDHYFSITDQVDYLLELWQLMEINNITLLAHDYGTAIAQEILARKNAGLCPIRIKELIYCNGNLPIKESHFLDTQEFLKKEVSKKLIAMLASIGIYKKTMREVFCDDSKITDEELSEMWYMLENDHGRDVIRFIYNYLRERKIFWGRWVNALKETNVPVKVVWSKNDPLIDENFTEYLSRKTKNNEIYWIENSGHFPMLETPKEWLEAVLSD